MKVHQYLTMWNIFKRKIHEPLADQLADLDHYPQEFANLITNGLDCDVLPGSSGPFGGPSNPIPVNGAIGELKYLAKLRGKSGSALFFHRISSILTALSEHAIDAYEVVCMDGTQWTTVHFDMYHPRRSNMAPEGFTLNPLDRRLKIDLPFAYGVTQFVKDFPYGLPDALISFYGMHPGETFARHAREKLEMHSFTREKEH